MSQGIAAASRFTVIVVNYDGGDLLPACVESVVAAGLAPRAIVVVDNGSRDGSPERLSARWPACRVVRNPCNAGFARAVNQGLSLVRTEFALLLNNDARIAPDALERLAAAFDSLPRAALLGGRLRNVDGRLQNSVAAFPRPLAELLPPAVRRLAWPERYRGRPPGEEPLRVETVIGALLAARMSAVREFGPLDEDFFFFFEETEWCHRAARNGWEVWHVPAAQAVHLQGATAKRHSAAARIEYHRSRLVYWRKTAPRWHAWLVALAYAKAALAALGGALLAAVTLLLARNRREKALVQARILLWYLRGRPDDAGLPGKCPKDGAPAAIAPR